MELNPVVKLVITPSSATIEGGSLTIYDIIRLTFSTMLNFADQTVAAFEAENPIGPTPDGILTQEQKDSYLTQLKTEICDYINTAALNVVTVFHPEYEDNNDLIDEAILEVADERLAEQLAAMSDEDKAAAAKFIEDRKLHFASRATKAMSVDDVLGKVVTVPPATIPSDPTEPTPIPDPIPQSYPPLSVIKGGSEK